MFFISGRLQHSLFPLHCNVSWVYTFVHKWPIAPLFPLLTFYVSWVFTFVSKVANCSISFPHLLSMSLGCLHLPYFQESSIPNMNETSTLQTKSGFREHDSNSYQSFSKVVPNLMRAFLFLRCGLDYVRHTMCMTSLSLAM